MAPTLTSFVNSFNMRLEPRVQKHLKNVYGCLSMSFLAAAAGAYVHMYTYFLQAGLLSTLGAFGLLFALHMTPDNRKNQSIRLQYLLGFAFLSGVGMGPLLELAISIDPTIVPSALIGTSIVFVSFTMTALLAPRGHWLYLGGTLISALNMMAIFSLMNIFLRSQLIYSIHLYIGLLVMCAFVIYDTQLIVEKNRMGSNDFIAHSLDLLLDFILIFRHLIVLLTTKEQRNNNKRRRE